MSSSDGRAYRSVNPAAGMSTPQKIYLCRMAQPILLGYKLPIGAIWRLAAEDGAELVTEVLASVGITDIGYITSTRILLSPGTANLLTY